MAVGSARVSRVTGLLPKGSSRSKIPGKALVEVVNQLGSEAYGIIQNDFRRGIPEKGTWSYETVKTMSTTSSAGCRNGPLFISEVSPHGMLGIMLQNREDSFIVSGSV